MIQKRFKNVGEDILQYGDWWCGAKGEHCAEVIAIALNQLIEENEQLKEKLNEIKKGLISDLEKGIGEQPFVISMYLQSIIDLIGDVE